MNTKGVNSSYRASNRSQRGRSPGGRSQGSGIRLISAATGVIIVLILVLVLAEMSMRFFVGREIANEYEQVQADRGVTVSEKADVNFGSLPLLPALLTKDVPRLTLTTPSTLKIENADALSGAPEISGDPAATSVLHNIDISNRNNPVAKSAHITTTVPTELLQAAANKRSQGSSRISTMTANPAAGEFDVEFSSGLLTTQLRPAAVDGQLVMQIDGATVLGFDVNSLAQWMGDALQESLTVNVGEGLRVEEATVTDDGLALTLVGENLPLQAITQLHFG